MAYGIYSNLDSSPELQRNLLKVNARQGQPARSVDRDGRPIRRAGVRGQVYGATADVLANRGARADKFAHLGMAKKRSDLVHRGRMAGHRADKIALKNRKQRMPWTIGIGGGTALLSMLDAKSRRNAQAEQTQIAERRHQDLMRMYQNGGRA